MDIVETLRRRAEQNAKVSQMLALDKSNRNKAAGEPDASYDGGIPEQMLEWKAADEITRLRAMLDNFITGHTDADLQMIANKDSWSSELSHRDAAIQIELRRLVGYVSPTK